MTKISIIMPSLNVCHYIRDCIESVCSQTFSDLEILCIDAGSTDGTLDILQEYAKKDSRITIHISEKKSYGYQVNLGITLAKGQYVGVVETDDVIDPHMYEILYNGIVDTELDYVKAQGIFWREILPKEYVEIPISIYDGIEKDTIKYPNREPMLEYYDRYLWLGLYRKDFISKIHLNESAGAAFQDIGFSLQIHSIAKKAKYLEDIVYYYRIESEGSSGTSNKAFRYLLQEYKYNYSCITNLGIDWEKVYLKKMYSQILSRFIYMAYQGALNTEIIEDINSLIMIFRNAIERNVLRYTDFGEEDWVKLTLFLENPYALYGAVSVNIKRLINRRKSLGMQLVQREVVLFGVGKRAKFAYAFFSRNKIGHLVAACDNNIGMQGTKFYDLEVKSLECILMDYCNPFFVITSSRFCDEIRTQLVANNVSDTDIYLYDFGEDFYLLDKMNKIEK